MRDLVFVSYRQTDSAGPAERLTNELRARLPADSIFFDTASVKSGEQYPEKIKRGLDRAHAVLVVVGRDWLTGTIGRFGQPRIDQQDAGYTAKLSTRWKPLESLRSRSSSEVQRCLQSSACRWNLRNSPIA